MKIPKVAYISSFLLSGSCLLVGCGSTSVGETAQHGNYPEIVVTRSEQAPLVIADDGSAASAPLVLRAREIVALDQEIVGWQQQADGDEDVLNGILGVIAEARADAVQELEEAWAASNSRSWGSSASHLDAADRSMASARSALSASIPDSVYCQTQISAVEEGSYIHYLPEGIYRDGGEDWVSYTRGTRIKIGNYRFRVSGQQTPAYDEKVTILQNPFVHVLQPRQARP